MSSVDIFGIGTQIVVRLPGLVQPELSPLGTGYIYFDSTSNLFMMSQNGGAYVPLGGGGGSQTLAQTLLIGNTTGGTNIVVSSGDAINGAAALPLAAGAASDLTLAARGSTPIPFNQAGQIALNVAYTGVGRNSVVGALNALVDGSVTPSAPALSAVLAVGNTSGANNVSVNTGQKVLGAAELTLDGTTVLNLQTGATTRWQVSAAGHLLPGTTDNAEDIGAAGVNRIRSLYAGTSVVVGSSVTVTNAAVTGSVGLALSATTGAASLSAAAGSVTVSTAGGNNVIVDGSGIIDMRIAGVSRWQVNASGNLVASTDNTNTIGSTGANRPSTVNVGTSVVVAGAATLTGTALTATGALSATAGAAFDLSLSGRGAATNLNQAGQTALNAAYTGVGRTSLIGALNALVDGTVTPTAPALSAVLAVGNTTGANNISVNTGQKVLGAAELTLDGTTVMNLQTGAVTRWQVSAAGHLLPGTTDNAEDIGAAATNRIRTLYAGTSVVVGATVTINGTTNTITSSGNLTVDTAVAGTLNLGNANATTVVVGMGTTAITAAGDVTVTGNLTVNGTTTTVNSTNLTVADPLIYANNGGLDPSFAGIAWDQGAALDVITVWNPTDGRMEFGRFNTVGGTVLPAGPLAVLTDIRASSLSLAGTAITADSALAVTATASALTLAATGANIIQFTTNGASRWNVASSGNLLANTDNTLDIGAVGANRPQRVYVGTEVVVGNTITIGSSTIASSTTLAVTSANGTGGGAGSLLSVTAGAGNGAGVGGSLALSAGAGGATGAGSSATLSGGAGGATSGNGGNAVVTGGSVTSGQGGAVQIFGANGAVAGAGGNVTLTAGSGATVGLAGDVSIGAGSGGTTSGGGNVTIQGGVGGVTNGNGGATSVAAGAASGTGTGGVLSLSGGVSPAGTGGELKLRTGDAALSDRMRVLSTGLVGIGSGIPLSTLDVQGSFGQQVTSISSSTTADATAVVWLVNATGGSVTLTLPTAASAQRRVYHVKKTDSSLNTVIVAGNGAETIDGSNTQSLIAQYESIQIVSDGTAWYIL